MTQEDKDLLLRDLSARLPYRVKCNIPCEPHIATIQTIDTVYLDGCVVVDYSNSIDSHFPLEDIKPYLRPMSSMTGKEIEELLNIDTKRVIFSSRHLTWYLDGEVADYLNSHHFDYRRLIPKGLALEAPEGMYN